MEMEPRERMLVEVIVGAIFVVLLILSSVIVISASKGTEIENSYNTYNIYNVESQVKPYVVDSGEYKKVYYTTRDARYEDGYSRYLDFSDYGNFRAFKGALGQNVDDYEVYVTNNEYVGGYFKVVYYFTDPYGNEMSYAVNNYVPAHGEKRFFYRDVTHGHMYDNWHYKVESLSKVSGRVYYNN